SVLVASGKRHHRFEDYRDARTEAGARRARHYRRHRHRNRSRRERHHRLGHRGNAATSRGHAGMTAFLIIAGLILLNGLFVAAEFAIVGAPRAAIDARVARGNRLARGVQTVLRDARLQDHYIATAQLGITIASLGLGMYGEHVLADRLFTLLGRAAGPAWLFSHGVASVVAIAILTYFHIVIGEMVPKSLALQQAERMALWITPPMLWIKNIVYPLVVALNATSNVV